MKGKVIVRSPELPEIELESIDQRHLEFLRSLKNAHRHRFFHQDEITPEQQRHWYEGYCERAGDWLFVVRCRKVDVACIGYRLVDGRPDLYNLLRASAPGADATALVAPAMDLFFSFAYRQTGQPLRGRGLASNPVLRWSRKHGFRKVDEGAQDGLPFVVMEQDVTRARFYPFTVDTMEHA